MKYLNKREKTKQEILCAFGNLYRDNEISDITVKRICEAAHINRSTFYNHFEDIYQLRSQFEEELMDQMIGRLFDDPEIIVNMDIGRIESKLIEFIKSSDGMPIIVVKRSDKDFTGRLMDYYFRTASEMGIVVPEETQMEIATAVRYHIGGVIAVLESMDKDNPVDDAEEIVGGIAKFALEGAITVIHEILRKRMSR